MLTRMWRTQGWLAKNLPIGKPVPSPSPRCFARGPRIAFPSGVAEVTQDEATERGKRRRSFGPIFLVVVLAVFGGWWWSAQRNESTEASAVKWTLHLETFVVNLADPERRSYLRIGVDLGLGRELRHGEDAPVAQVRDTILGVLDGARADDLLTAEGKSKLKADVLQALKERVPDLDVEEVYFTELLIQR
jgi:flagellar basal body-associated protein FliL